MGRRKEFEVSPTGVKHLPSGIMAHYIQKGEEGQVRGYWTDDLFMGTSIQAVKKFFRQVYGGWKK